MKRFCDMHCHLRREYLLYEVVRYTAQYCAYAVIMPNTKPAILNAKDALEYKKEIVACVEHINGYFPKVSSLFQPLMTIEIRDNTTPQMIEEAKEAGVVAGKIYPCGVTTNSEEGLRDFFSPQIKDTFKAMANTGMLRLIHGELDLPRIPYFERERAFIPTLLKLIDNHPDLKTVVEHVSTKEIIEVIKQGGPNLAGTITAHHPLLTYNDVRLNPHLICNPTPNGFNDRDALLEAMISGNPQFFKGSDSAPHPIENKECNKISCGVFSAPVLPQVLVETFENANALNRLEDFTSTFGAQFYSLPLVKEAITLVKKEWTVPLQYGHVVPFKAGEKLKWQLA